MKCPTDGTTLTMSERGGIEIDYGPECRGVWLDRGELDKIIERAQPAAVAQPTPGWDEPRREEPRRGYDEPYRGEPRRRKKRSFLDDLFDFD
jgi:Zn-finger nucleic acid-binding protein